MFFCSQHPNSVNGWTAMQSLLGCGGNMMLKSTEYLYPVTSRSRLSVLKSQDVTEFYLAALEV